MHIQNLDWSSHTHIGLDLDETLASSFSGFLDYAKTQGKLLMCSSIEDFTCHDIFTDPYFQISQEEVVELWKNYGLTIQSPLDTLPIDHARAGVDMLRSRHKEYSIITARNGHDLNKRNRTINWVRHYFSEIGEDRVHFVNHYVKEAKPKSEVCKDIGITLMIDDYIENARDLCSHGISMILLEKPWNRSESFEHPLLYRAKDWNEIIQSLQK